MLWMYSIRKLVQFTRWSAYKEVDLIAVECGVTKVAYKEVRVVALGACVYVAVRGP